MIIYKYTYYNKYNSKKYTYKNNKYNSEKYTYNNIY